MDIFDQDLLDRFAIAAMEAQDWASHDLTNYRAVRCWQIAFAMKKERDRVCGKQEPKNGAM